MDDNHQQLIDSIAPSGRLRAAINFGNIVLAQRFPTGEPQGVSVTLAREMAARLGLPLDLVTFDAAGQVFDALVERGAWDVAFLAIDPQRGTQIDFTSPYVTIQGTYLVPCDSPFGSTGDVDRPGIRIAASRGSAYELYLRRHLRHAELVCADSPEASFRLFMDGKLDAMASVRQPLSLLAAEYPGLRVLGDAYMRVDQAIGTPKGRAPALRWLNDLIAETKTSGFLAEALRSSGQGDAVLAP
ncbi:ABC transporter substrate-binding protein [Variovorax ginsengisoli]|uniref:ABC transporter substrate-binding protein n=1 Tax=Variovorax ginsengisoli TaxID=363844 RepID=A0ABT8SF50_9BURK|nr:ABC transporter substrate-binding protein [Variovorax ginsengisoli]MDN8618205.1 ABC transporter substrate-binding protein [Variovorax ginsengisoli]MDO1537375.1 ABC transporter substrate-binding protein [Variovorax ginsengisoli]